MLTYVLQQYLNKFDRSLVDYPKNTVQFECLVFGISNMFRNYHYDTKFYFHPNIKNDIISSKCDIKSVYLWIKYFYHILTKFLTIGGFYSFI